MVTNETVRTLLGLNLVVLFQLLSKLVFANSMRAESPAGIDSDLSECEEVIIEMLGGAVTARGGEKRAKSRGRGWRALTYGGERACDSPATNKQTIL